MKKGIISAVLSVLFITSLSGNVVFADELEVNNEVLIQEEQSNYNFEDTPEEVINQMKEDLNLSKLNGEFSPNDRNFASLRGSTIDYTSLMAASLSGMGFKHAGDLLNYSMLTFREEPYRFQSTSLLSGDIWAYSTDFRAVVTSFLNEARANNSYQYFKSTNMEFNMPNASKAQILTDMGLLKRTDLFGALHGVTIHLGIVKQGIQWDMMVMIEDTYDFKKEQYDGLVSIVNNMAYNEQERGKIKPYKVLITANKPYLTAPPFNVPIW